MKNYQEGQAPSPDINVLEGAPTIAEVAQELEMTEKGAASKETVAAFTGVPDLTRMTGLSVNEKEIIGKYLLSDHFREWKGAFKGVTIGEHETAAYRERMEEQKVIWKREYTTSEEHISLQTEENGRKNYQRSSHHASDILVARWGGEMDARASEGVEGLVVSRTKEILIEFLNSPRVAEFVKITQRELKTSSSSKDRYNLAERLLPILLGSNEVPKRRVFSKDQEEAIAKHYTRPDFCPRKRRREARVL